MDRDSIRSPSSNISNIMVFALLIGENRGNSMISMGYYEIGEKYQFSLKFQGNR